MVTIDIEDNVVKILNLNGNSIISAVEEPLEPGLVKDGVVLNPGAVGQIISDTLRANGIHEKNVVVTVSGINSIYRVARLPKLSGDLMMEAIKREMARLIPVPLDDLYTSWQIIHESGDEVIVPIIAIPREVIDLMLSVMRTAGLNVRTMDSKPLAIARVADETTAIMVNVQPSCFDIVIVTYGIPEIIRSLPFSETAASFDDKNNEVLEELERTINFYNSSDPEKKIPDGVPVFVSGPLRDIITVNNTSYTIKSIPELLLYPPAFNSEFFVPNIGLALKRAKIKNFPIKLNLNVLPSAYLPKPLSMVRLFSWIFIIFAAAILIFTIINLQQVISQNNLLKNQIDNLNLQLQSRTESIPEIDNLKTRLQSLETEQDDLQILLDGFTKQRASVRQDLGVITSKLSGDISLSSINYSAIWTVRGNAPDPYAIMNYVFALRDSNRFSLVQLSGMSELVYNKWDFIITIDRIIN